MLGFARPWDGGGGPHRRRGTPAEDSHHSWGFGLKPNLGLCSGEAKKDRKGQVRSNDFGNRAEDQDGKFARKWKSSSFVSKSTRSFDVATPAGKQCRKGSRTEGGREV